MHFKKVDTLSADILDKDFIKVFQPLHLIQKLLGFHRVNIDYKFVTAPSVKYKLYSCTVWVVNAISLVGYLVLCDSVLGSINIDFMLQVSLTMNGVLNTAIAWQNNFCYENLNSQLYVKLQSIDRKLKLSNSVLMNKRIALFSVAATLFGSSVCFTWTLVCNLILAKKICFPFFFVLLMAMTNTLEMYLLWNIFLFLISRTIYVNNILRTKLSIYTTQKNSDTVCGQKKNVWTVNAHEDIDGFQELVYGIHSILDTLADVITLFSFPVFVFVSQTLFCNLTLVQCIVDSIKEKMPVSSYLWVATLPIHVALAIVIIVMAITAGFLTSKLEVTRKLSSYIKSALNDGTLRDYSKQLLTLLTKERCEISIYNIFILDYRLPLQLFAITATYIIVLLQLTTL